MFSEHLHPYKEIDAMQEQETLNILMGTKTLIKDGHFVMDPGGRRHCSEFENREALYAHSMETSLLCEEVANRFAQNGIGAVVGDGTHGLTLAQWTAEYLSRKTGYESRVLSLYTDKESGLWRTGFALSPLYRNLVAGKKVLVVRDFLVSGETTRNVMEAVREAGGKVFGLCALVNQCGLGRMDLEVPKFEALATWPVPETWDESECPLCKAGVPVDVGFGHGKAFLLREGMARALSHRK